MIVKFQDYPGHIVLDDNTGKILSILCGEGNKVDARTFYSYSNENGKQFKLDIVK